MIVESKSGKLAKRNYSYFKINHTKLKYKSNIFCIDNTITDWSTDRSTKPQENESIYPVNKIPLEIWFEYNAIINKSPKMQNFVNTSAINDDGSIIEGSEGFTHLIWTVNSIAIIDFNVRPLRSIFRWNNYKNHKSDTSDENIVTVEKCGLLEVQDKKVTHEVILEISNLTNELIDNVGSYSDYVNDYTIFESLKMIKYIGGAILLNERDNRLQLSFADKKWKLFLKKNLT